MVDAVTCSRTSFWIFDCVHIRMKDILVHAGLLDPYVKTARLAPDVTQRIALVRIDRRESSDPGIFPFVRADGLVAVDGKELESIHKHGRLAMRQFHEKLKLRGTNPPPHDDVGVLEKGPIFDSFRIYSIEVERGYVLCHFFFAPAITIVEFPARLAGVASHDVAHFAQFVHLCGCDRFVVLEVLAVRIRQVCAW